MTQNRNTTESRLIAAFVFLTSFFIIGLAAPVTAQEKTTQLSTAQAQIIARQAVIQGDFQLADAISSALLQANPDDAQALLVRAMLLRATGQHDKAFDAAKSAYQNSDIPALRFDAAMLAADVATRQEKFTTAQWWLRRADQAAPDEPRQQLAANAYRSVSRQNPLQVQLRFSAKPSNNVNNGAENSVVFVGGLPFTLNDSGLQLGGVVADFGSTISYRVSQSEKHRTDFIADIFLRKVWLSDSAKETAPTASGSDYDYGALVLGVRHRRAIWPERGPTEFTGLVGQTWFGGQELARWGELKLGQTFKRSDRTALRFGTSLRAENRIGDDINDSKSLGLSLDYIVNGEGGSSYSIGASTKNVISDSATVDALSFGVNARRSFAQIGAMVPSLAVSAETRDYQKWTTTIDGRRDSTLSLSVNLVFPEINYYGFAPQLSVTARKTSSNIDIYDRNEFAAALTVVSRF